MTLGAAIMAPAGQALTQWEKAFFAEYDPWGFILFARNIDTPDQLRRLTDQLRDIAGRDAPILIDQEGGRVERMTAPHWRRYLPPLTQMERASDPIRAMWVRARLIADDLHKVGIDVNCAPVGDVATDETHPFLRNRCYGSDPQVVADAGRAIADGTMAGGVLPVMKHMPGHGRARADSHKEVPRVQADPEELRDVDFVPFTSWADLPLGMTGHVVFTHLAPGTPTTISDTMIGLIREEIGFQGLLMTDDIGMDALPGGVGLRSRLAKSAGCDVILHSSGIRAEMEEVAAEAGDMSPEAEARGEAALARRKAPDAADIPALEAELASLLG